MIKNILKNILAITIISLSLYYIVLNIPVVHRASLRNKIGKEVVKIVNEVGNSGGTGVYIKLPSGNVAILTNAHVCGVKNEQNMVWVLNDEDRAIPRKVLEESKTSDICLIEGLPDHRGLDLGEDPSFGDNIYIVGHPRLMPTTMVNGEIFTKQFVDVLIAISIVPISSDSCNLPKNRVEKEDSFFGPVWLCLEHIESYISTAQILPGNSGSPVVNDSGKLVGLAYAGMNDIN